MRTLVMVLVLSIAACSSTPVAPATPQTGGAGAAVVNTAVAVTAAVISRNAGGCVATCTNGTLCNEAKGVCELPCDGQCGAGETCDVPKNLCVPMAIDTATVAPPRR